MPPPFLARRSIGGPAQPWKWLQYGYFADWRCSLAAWFAATLVLATLVSPVASFAQAEADPRMFAQTGFRIDRDAFFDYFGHRGGVATFGYPVSRDFQFEGCTSQFFQRLIVQQCGTQGVGTANLLDEGLLPYTKMNGSTFPASD